MQKIHVIATSHGTANPTGQQSISEIRDALAEILSQSNVFDVSVSEAFVDVQEPSLDEVMAGFTPDDVVVIVPLLLSTGFHTQVDMQRAAKNSPARQVHLAAPLGPSPELAHLQVIRLKETGWTPNRTAVMAAAGSSRADGREAVAVQSMLLSLQAGKETQYGFCAAIDPKITDITAQHPDAVISSYLLAPGHFHSRLENITRQHPDISVSAPLMVPGDRAAALHIANVAVQRIFEELTNQQTSAKT